MGDGPLAGSIHHVTSTTCRHERDTTSVLALAWDAASGHADLGYEAGALRSGDELYTAVVLSLFLDAPARPGDDVPPGAARRGWWADAFGTEHPGDVTGSRLWLLERMSISDEKVRLAREYALEALEWMIEDGLVSETIVSAERFNGDSVALRVEIVKPGEVAPRLVGYWEALRGVQ